MTTQPQSVQERLEAILTAGRLSRNDDGSIESITDDIPAMTTFITQLFREVVTEAMPEKKDSYGGLNSWNAGYNTAIDDYHRNLLARLGGEG